MCANPPTSAFVSNSASGFDLLLLPEHYQNESDLVARPVSICAKFRRRSLMFFRIPFYSLQTDAHAYQEEGAMLSSPKAVESMSEKGGRWSLEWHYYFGANVDVQKIMIALGATGPCGV